METAVTAPVLGAVRRRTGLERLYSHERLLLSFFAFLACLGLIRPLPWVHRALLICLPCLVYSLLAWETGRSRPWTRIVREWAALGLILPAYWSMACFSASHSSYWQFTWISWDRTLLDGLGLKHSIESLGSFLPRLLETSYLLLYAFPPAALGILYLCKQRDRCRRFLLILFLGTLAAYVLLPVLPVESPRLAFPNEDLPAFHGFPRSMNVWLLDRLDISTSVFPSGHVAVAFSCAFGLLSAVPALRRIWLTGFLVALSVFVATIYGRYHYAADGFASICIASLAWRVGEWMESDEV